MQQPQQTNDEMEAMHKERRILHFSDGTMEEGAMDSDDEKDVPDNTVKDTELLSRLKYTANKILAGIDYMGGGIADFFGISTPKYASEIEYYKREAMTNTETDMMDNGNDVWLRSYEKINDDGSQLSSLAPNTVIAMEPK